MALYQGLNQSRAGAVGEGGRQADPAPKPWRRLQVAAAPAPGAGSGHWLDKMLGQGSRQALKLRPQAPRAAAPAPAPRSAAAQVKRFQAFGAPEALPRGRKGVIRSLVAALAIAWAVLALKPWQLRGDLKSDLWALFSQPSAADKAAQALEQRKHELAEAQRLASLPVIPGGGKALALWQDGSGRWWSVEAQGLLSPHAGPAAKEGLGLPELRGAQALHEEHGQGQRLRLDLGSLDLEALLPLKAGLASEVRAVQVGPEGPVLLTHEGIRCLLGQEDWGKREERLGLVLADLAARGRRVQTVDLRFEDTAVVR